MMWPALAKRLFMAIKRTVSVMFKAVKSRRYVKKEWGRRGSRIANGMVRRFYLVSSLCMRGLRRRRPMDLHTIGIDLGKTVFHLVGLNLHGEAVPVGRLYARNRWGWSSSTISP